jgi:hypothetical protein
MDRTAFGLIAACSVDETASSRFEPTDEAFASPVLAPKRSSPQFRD